MLFNYNKYNGGTGIGETCLFQNVEMGSRKEVTGPKEVQNLAQQIPLDLKS